MICELKLFFSHGKGLVWLWSSIGNTRVGFFCRLTNDSIFSKPFSLDWLINNCHCTDLSVLSFFYYVMIIRYLLCCVCGSMISLFWYLLAWLPIPGPMMGLYFYSIHMVKIKWYSWYFFSVLSLWYGVILLLVIIILRLLKLLIQNHPVFDFTCLTCAVGFDDPNQRYG